MPRRKTAVKTKSIGAVDIHFHGAFGIDLMTASPKALDELASLLTDQGVAAFCPTTLSAPFADLRQSIRQLGKWIQAQPRPGTRIETEHQSKAHPLGIHLEGPYIEGGACGAHPPESIRQLSFSELDILWEDSRHTLKILTLAPELLTPQELTRLGAWAQKRKVTLSLGHSRANQEQAARAFDQGFRGVTHAWNALPFHHRSAGPLGAALGRKEIAIELIIDQIHVAPTVLRWTRHLHGDGLLCYVSDCVPAAATRAGTWHPFGGLKIRFKEGACRLSDDQLAGGGVLLPTAFSRWIEKEAEFESRPALEILREQLRGITLDPLTYLGLADSTEWLAKRLSLEWWVTPRGKIEFISC